MPTDLTTHIANFKKWLANDTETAPGWQKGLAERLAWYGMHLSKEAIGKLSPVEFATLIKDLWATNIWKNKDYKVEQLIKDNGLEKLRLNLDVLLYGNDPLDKRWDKFRTSIKGLGPSSISEILTFSDPHQYALVNLKPYEVLPRLGMSISPVGDGKSYTKAVEEIGKVKLQLSQNDVNDADFILTDFFIAYLFSQVFHLERKRKEPPVEEPSPPAKLSLPATVSIAGEIRVASHEGAQAVLLMLGKLLDFDTYTADPSKEYNGQKLGDLATLRELPDFAGKKAMDSARRIDVVWVNSEWPECFFEIEQSTGVTPGLGRMFQVIKVDAKFFVIAPEDERKRFQREVDKAPYKEVKQKYRFRSYEELRDMYQACANYRKVKDQFLTKKDT
jgi:hypothetical protein